VKFAKKLSERDRSFAFVKILANRLLFAVKARCEPHNTVQSSIVFPRRDFYIAHRVSIIDNFLQTFAKIFVMTLPYRICFIMSLLYNFMYIPMFVTGFYPFYIRKSSFRGANLLARYAHWNPNREFRIESTRVSNVQPHDSVEIPSNQMYQVASFYKFRSYEANEIEEIIEKTKDRLCETCIRGTVIVSEEGYNGQISLPIDSRSREEVLESLRQSLRDNSLELNIGRPFNCTIPPFKKLLVKKRATLTADAKNLTANHVDVDFDLSSMHWQNKILASNSRMILDVRNHYESSIGSFSGSTPLNTSTYAETWERLDQLMHNQPLDQEIFAFCTGGIRCVKAARYLHDKGFRNIYTLKHGIIGYENWINETNETSLFYGENYLFDRRRLSDMPNE
jgi:UPF0176 protein